MSNIVTVISNIGVIPTFASLPVGTIFRRTGDISDPNVYIKYTNLAKQDFAISLETGIVRSMANWITVEVLHNICIKSE